MDKFADLKLWIVSVLEREHSQKPVIAKDEVMQDIMGYMSHIVRFHLTWPNNSESLPRTVVAKIPTTETFGKRFEGTPGPAPAASPDDTFLRIIHQTELACYAILSRGKCEGLAIPFLYGSLPYSSPTPCILMEDIHSSKVYDLLDGFTDDQLYRVVDQLVALHVFCLTHDEWKAIGFDELGADDSYNKFVAMFQMICELLKSMSPLLKQGLALLHDNYTRNQKWFLDEVRYYENEGVPRTFVHGDLWTANILWRGENVAAIVDWSMCHPGSLTADLQRVLVTCCSAEQRRRMTRPLLEYYFKRMQTKTKEKRMEMPFTFKDLEYWILGSSSFQRERFIPYSLPVLPCWNLGIIIELFSSSVSYEEDYHRTLPFTCGQTTFATGLWLQTGVIRKGGSNDATRVQEILVRLHSVIEDTAAAHKWQLAKNP